FTQIGNQILKGIIFWVGCPNELAHVIHDLARDARNLLNLIFCCLLSFETLLSHFAEQRDAGEAGAQIVMQVASYAAALTNQGMLLFQFKQAMLPAQAVSLNTGCEPDNAHPARNVELPGFVEVRCHEKAELYRLLIPAPM